MKKAKTPLEFIEKRKWILPSILSIVIFLLAVWRVGEFNQFLLFDDEFGYWTGSAYFTGTDWKSVASGIPYYSYGYGLLILTPIRLLFHSGPARYHAAIVVNALLLVGSFWIARYVTNRLFPKVNWVFRDVLCALCQVYASYLVFSHIAWAECCLVFVFWVFVWLSMRVIEKPGILNHIGIALNVILLYVIHQRTLAVMIATVMVMVWLFIIEKERRKDIIIFGISFGVIFFIHSLIKTDLLDQYYHNMSTHHRGLTIVLLLCMMVMALFFVDKKRRKIIIGLGVALGGLFLFYTLVKMDLTADYSNNNRVSLNELSGQMGKLKSILTFDGFVNLLHSMLGKWFYLTMASFMMLWWSAEEGFRKLGAYAGEVRNMVKKHQLFKMKSGMEIWYIWLLLAFAGNFMVAAIYMINTTRNDILMYGRYTEYMIGIYVIIGVMAFMQDKHWVRKTIAYVLVAAYSGWLCEKILSDLGMSNFQPYHSIYTSLFLEKGVPTYGDVYQFTVFAVIACLIVIILLKLEIGSKRGKKTGNKAGNKAGNKIGWIPKALIPIPMVILFCYISSPIVYGTIVEKQALRVINIESVVNWLDWVDEGEDHKVYYLTDTENRYWSESFQFMLMEKPLTLINSSEINLEEDAFYITGDDFVNWGGYEENFYCIKKSYQFAVSVKKDSELAERARKLKGE